MARHLNPSQENPFIEIGKLLSEESYKRERKEVRVENIVVDILRSGDGEIIVGEVKKSSRYEKSAQMQLCYYLYRLKEMGVSAKGILLFPKEKKRIEVTLTDDIEEELKIAVREINQIVVRDVPPLLKKIKFCKKCGYNEFCWS